MDKTIQIQTQIRQNAEEISSALSEMSKWEKTMKNRDGNIKAAHEKAARVPRAPIRSGVGTVPVIAKNIVDSNKKKEVTKTSDPLWQTPSSIITSRVRNAVPEAKTTSVASVPQALGNYQARDLEETERERGNSEFKTGNFTAAVKSYTKCLGLKGKNYVAFSNRAMAYLKLKEYARAVSDCNCALQIDPSHIKSLLRRATAYNALGKHRAALRDLLRAAQLEPANKVVRSDVVNTKEQLRSAVNRAPSIPLQPRHTMQSSAGDSAQGSAGDSAQGSAAAVALQGPDPRPPSYIPPTASVTTDNTTTSDIATTAASASMEADRVVTSTDATQVGQEEALSSWEVVPGGDKDNSSGTCATDDLSSATTAAAPTVATTTAATDSNTTVATAAAGTRVAIVCDDDSSDDEENTTTTGISVATTARTLASTTAAITTPSKPTNTTATSSSTSKKVRPPSSPVPTTPTTTLPLPPLRSSYDLERELNNAGSDMKLTGLLFKRLKTTHLKKLLSDCLEPSVVYLLLTSVSRYYGTYKQKWYKVILWYSAVKDLKRFVTLYALMSVEYVRELHDLLIQVQNHIKNTEVSEENSSTGTNSSSMLVGVEQLLTIY